MDRKFLLGGVAAAALLIGGAMQAQATDAPDATASAGWSGFYIGAGGGVNYLLSPGSDIWAADDIYDDNKSAGAWADLGKAGGFGTVEGGFDLQRNRLVFGILANYDFGKKVAKFAGYGDSDYKAPTEIYGRLTMTNSWGIAARAGMLNNTQDTLWYALVGYTAAKIKGESCWYLDGENTCYGDGDIGGPLVADKTKGGATVGVGVESMLTHSLSLKIEYRYTNFGDIKASFDNDEEVQYMTFHPRDHSLRAVLNWRFGHRGP